MARTLLILVLVLSVMVATTTARPWANLLHENLFPWLANEVSTLSFKQKIKPLPRIKNGLEIQGYFDDNQLRASGIQNLISIIISVIFCSNISESLRLHWKHKNFSVDF